ncbi:MAG: DUF3857 domain-containing protein [Burkholderiales bacterium]
MLKFARLVLIPACLVFSTWAARAADVTYNEYNVAYEVQADGRFTREKKQIIRINTAQGVQRNGQVPLPYSASLQILDIVEAYVVSPDGQRTDVPAYRIIEQQSPQSAQAPLFDDGKVRTVIFPALQVGSVIHLHTRLTQVKPLFPGHFSDVQTMPTTEVNAATVSVRTPSSLKLYVDAQGMAEAAEETDSGGMTTRRWQVKGLRAAASEIGSVAPTDHRPRLAMTTLATEQAAADAYAARALPQAAVTPSIQKLADDITTNSRDRLAQAEDIYRWVISNIRYVAIFLDVGGVVPHSADDIVAARYGDCKDQTTLLSALLAAKGIRSSPVLVNAGLNYWKPQVAATPGVFNHAILYLPEFKAYLDTTAQLAPFGTLSVTLLGKPALIVDAGEGKAQAVTLPVANPARDRVRVLTEMTLGTDGTVYSNAKVESHGVLGLLARQIFSAIPEGNQEQVVGRVLAATGQNGSGTYSAGFPRRLIEPYRYNTEVKLPDHVQLPGPGAFVIPAGFNSFSNIAVTFEQLGAAERVLPMPLLGRSIEEVLRLHLPAGFAPTTLPRGTSVDWLHGRYRSNVKLEGSTLTVTRQLEISPPSALLMPEDYPAFRTFGQAVMRDLRAQVVY